MDDIERDVTTNPGTGGAMGRRSLFGAGAVVALLTLTGCPGGEQDDEDGDDEGGGDDE